MKHIFGPVNSRRFGISLGIDLLTSKTCSLDCIYCECGRTKILTDKIYEYAPTAEVIAEIVEFLKNKPSLDAITFAGSGEPTLHNGIGKIIEFLKTNLSQYKIIVLTNGTLFNSKKTRQAVLNADIVVPSLDAASDEAFLKIARPAPGLTAEKLIRGLIAFRKEFRNKLILEVFIIPGINDNWKELRLIREACKKINPDLIQLNTLDRPGSEKWIRPASMGKLTEIKTFFGPFETQIIQNQRTEKEAQKIFANADIAGIVIASLARRPSTIEDMSLSLGISSNEVQKVIKSLLEKGEISREGSITRGIFYKLKTRD
jgi:wyosine [tRNA(Phe)-imidazoG37] synthetase (radical SAM superfamily)